MRRLLRILARTFALVLLALGALLLAAPFFDGPWGPLPGGALRSGPQVDLPARWPEGSVGETVEIETRPATPWSVTTWCVVLDGVLYVPADFLNPVKLWPFFALEDPRVRVRAGGVRYAARATLVRDTALDARLREAFARKYDLAPDGLAARSDVWFFRLEP